LIVFAPLAMAATGAAASGTATTNSPANSHAVTSRLEPFHTVTEADVHKFMLKNGSGGYLGVLGGVMYTNDGDGAVGFLFALHVGNPQPQNDLISQFTEQDQKYIKAWAEQHAPGKVFPPPVFVPGTTYIARIPEMGGSLPTYLYDTSGTLKGKTITSIFGGDPFRFLALCSDGTLSGCGFSGSLGLNGWSVTPVRVDTLGAMKGKKVTTICNIGHGYALCSDGSLFTWGGGQDTPQLVADGPLKNKKVTQLVNGWVFCADGTMVDLAEGVNQMIAFNQGVLRGKVVTAMTDCVGRAIALCADGTLAQLSIDKTGGKSLAANKESAPVPFTLPDPDGLLKGKTIVSIARIVDAKNVEHLMVLCSDGTLAVWALPSALGKSRAGVAPQIPGAATGARRGLAATRNPAGLTARGNTTPNGKPALPSDMASLRPTTLLSGTGLLAGKTVTSIYYPNRIVCSDGTLIDASHADNLKLVLDPSSGYFQGKKILSIVDNDILFQEPGPQVDAAPAPGAAP
jgi:hypothetical protein